MALTNERNTPEVGTDLAAFPVAANVRIFKGSLVALDAGYAKPGAVATGRVAVGRAEDTINNLGGGTGAKTVVVKPGCFRWANSAGNDGIAQTDVGADCYIVDDQTVAKTSGTATRSIAGKVLAIDANGVWVKTGL